MTTNQEKIILKKLREYEGQTVGDFMYSDFVDMFVDIIEINGHGIPHAEDYDSVDEGAIIDYINVRNVMGYIIADIATQEDE